MSVGVIGSLKQLVGESSRSIRESIVKFSPFLVLISLAAFLIDAAGEEGPFFLLFYMMLLVFFYLFTVMAIRELRDNFSQAEQYRYPPETDTTSKPAWPQIKHFSREFYQAEPEHDHLCQYEYEPVLPNIVYIGHSLYWTLVVWLITFYCLNFLIEIGVYQSLVDWLVNGEWQSLGIATAVLTYASGILVVFAEFLFPNVTMENRVLLFALVVIPGFFFLTAARNLIRLGQILNRWFLLWVYDPTNVVRKRGIVGYTALIVIYWGVFEALA